MNHQNMVGLFLLYCTNINRDKPELYNHQPTLKTAGKTSFYLFQVVFQMDSEMVRKAMVWLVGKSPIYIDYPLVMTNVAIENGHL